MQYLLIKNEKKDEKLTHTPVIKKKSLRKKRKKFKKKLKRERGCVGNFVIDRTISPEQFPGDTIPGTNIASTLSKRELCNIRAIRDL